MTFSSEITEHYQIVDFLNECEEQDWELDSDDIRHILKLDFEYVRKQNSTTSLNKGNEK